MTNLKRGAFGTPVGPGCVVEEHAAAGVHQPLDHRVSVLGRVRGLRNVGSSGNAFAELAQACDQLRDVTVLRVVRNTAQIPDDGTP